MRADSCLGAAVGTQDPMLSLRHIAYASRGCVCAVCGNESILLTMSLHFAAVVSVGDSHAQMLR